MLYRVIRDLGNSAYVVGSTFDGDALEPRRLRALVDQHKIEPVFEPGSEGEALAGMLGVLATLQADVASLTQDNARLADLEAQVAVLAEQNAELLAALTAPADEATEPTPDLAKLKVDELRAMATERGIEGAAAMKKDELLAALTAGQEAPSGESTQ